MLMSFEYGDGKGGNPANPAQQPQHPHQHQHSLLAHPKPVSFASSNVSSMDTSAQSSPVGSTADLTAVPNGAPGGSKQHDRLFSGFLSRPTSTRISSPFSLGIKSDIWGDDSSSTSQTSASSTSKFAPFEAPTPSSSSGSTVSQPPAAVLAPQQQQQQQQGEPRPSVVAAMSQANDFPGIDMSYLNDETAPGAAGSAHSSNFATHTNSSVSLSALGYGTGFGTPTSATVPPGAPNAAYFEEYPQQPFDPWGEDKRRAHMSGGPMMQPSVHQGNGMGPNGMPNPMAMPQPLANGMHMQGMMPQMAPVTPTVANAVQQQQPRRKANINSELYKTEMCSSFQKTGSCSYGEKCQFAHGEHELKNVDRPPKWRSKLCQNWLRTGTCAYNDRCCFKHA
ncbi:Zinc finger protein 36, C3H1 type-like 2-A [Yarrowia sp. C11]|nr:Zinc finger protein 36, C3H1 type-like 2-A [Yarrowia sp. C11]KAG5364516.1 Zinc finger protein 36, C3H1 type-like 2-A [Yarrowia sp. E02]